MGNILEPILNEQTPKVDKHSEINEELKTLSQEVLEFAKTYRDPVLVGIAANQLSLNGKRINEKFCCIQKQSDNNWIVAFNPSLIKKSGDEFESEEGCLTWPKKKIIAKRNSSVIVSYQDEQGEAKTIEAEGFEAIIWQHEINHLNGEKEVVINPRTGRVFGLSIEGGAPIQATKRNKPNKPCLCGSGKKYKKCCGK